MKKVIQIEGMSCAHCQAAVEKALGGIDGVTAKVDLKKKQATASISGSVADDALKAAVEEAGFQVVSITEKKGLFG